MTRLVVFTVADRRLAVALECVEKVVRMAALTPIQGAPPIIPGIINVNGRIMAAADPRVRLGLPVRAIQHTDRLLIASTRRRPIALIVDEVSAVVEIDDSLIVAMEAILPADGLIRGVARRPDGLLFIYDLDMFLSLDEERLLGEAMRELELPR